MANEETLTAEEIASEQEATKALDEQEIRTKVIEEYGFDEATEADRIDKATKKEIENRQRLNKTITAKIKYRTLANGKKEEVPPVQTKPTEVNNGNDMSFTDQRALINSNVHDDDIQEVKDFAKLKGISIAEALKHPIVSATLAENTEKRVTASATNTSIARRGPTKLSDEDRISQANAGKMPEKDEDIDSLMSAKFNQLKTKK